MDRTILVSLVIIGKDPVHGDFKFCLAKNGQKDSYYVPKTEVTIDLANDEEAVSKLIEEYLPSVDKKIVLLRRGDLLFSPKNLNIVFTGQMPINIKSDKLDWFCISDFININMSDSDKQILIAGVNH